MMMTAIIMGLLVAVLLSVMIITTEVYAQSNQITDLVLFDEIDVDE